MTDEPLILGLSVHAESDADDRETARLTQQLRRQLLEIDVDRVDLKREGVTPVGAKSAEAFTVGALVVTLAPTALAGAITLVQAWVNRNKGSSIQVTLADRSITIKGGRSDDTQRLLDAFLTSPGSKVDQE